MRTLQTLLLVMLLLGSGTASPDEVTLLPSDNGKTITVTPGTRITVRLESNPTTGYQWTLPTPPDARIVKRVTNQREAGPNPGTDEEPVVGAPGTEVWTYEAVGAGTATVTMTYLRVFAPGDNPSNFSFTVVVE